MALPQRDPMPHSRRVPVDIRPFRRASYRGLFLALAAVLVASWTELPLHVVGAACALLWVLRSLWDWVTSWAKRGERPPEAPLRPVEFWLREVAELTLLGSSSFFVGFIPKERGMLPADDATVLWWSVFGVLAAVRCAPTAISAWRARGTLDSPPQSGDGAG
jgi:hypothetical protein